MNRLDEIKQALQNQKMTTGTVIDNLIYVNNSVIDIAIQIITEMSEGYELVSVEKINIIVDHLDGLQRITDKDGLWYLKHQCEQVSISIKAMIKAAQEDGK